MRHFATAFAALLVVGTLSTSTCQAAGRWHVPSTPCQYMGYGFGPGYHAPMVLGPTWKSWPASPGVQRVAHPPQAPCPQCVGGFAGYGAANSYYPAGEFGASELMQAGPQFAPQPMPYETNKPTLLPEPPSPSETAPRLP
jgi:hypothetical protein